MHALSGGVISKIVISGPLPHVQDVAKINISTIAQAQITFYIKLLIKTCSLVCSNMVQQHHVDQI